MFPYFKILSCESEYGTKIIIDLIWMLSIMSSFDLVTFLNLQLEKKWNTLVRFFKKKDSWFPSRKLRIGTPRQGMNELCTKSWLPLANVGSSVLHRPRRLYLKRVKLLLSVLKHEFLEVLVISRHGSNSCWKPRAVCHWALGGLCHSRVSNEVLKVPDLGDENTTALLLKFPHEADFRWNVFYTERTEVSEWRVCWGGPLWLCPHSTALEAALFGLPASAWHCCWSCPGSAGSGTFRKLSHSLKSP